MRIIAEQIWGNHRKVLVQQGLS